MTVEENNYYCKIRGKCKKIERDKCNERFFFLPTGTHTGRGVLQVYRIRYFETSTLISDSVGILLYNICEHKYLFTKSTYIMCTILTSTYESTKIYEISQEPRTVRVNHSRQ